MSGSAALTAALKRRGGMETKLNNKSVSFENNNFTRNNLENEKEISMTYEEFLQELDNRISKIERFLPILSHSTQSNTTLINSQSNSLMRNALEISKLKDLEEKYSNICNFLNNLDTNETIPQSNTTTLASQSSESTDSKNNKTKPKANSQNKVKLNIDENH